MDVKLFKAIGFYQLIRHWFSRESMNWYWTVMLVVLWLSVIIQCMQIFRLYLEIDNVPVFTYANEVCLRYYFSVQGIRNDVEQERSIGRNVRHPIRVHGLWSLGLVPVALLPGRAEIMDPCVLRSSLMLNALLGPYTVVHKQVYNICQTGWYRSPLPDIHI